MFLDKQWSLGGLKKLIRKIDDTGTVDRRSAPAHRALETVELLKVETPDFIPPNLWPSNSPDLNPVDYKIWSLLQERVYRTSIKDVDEYDAKLLKNGTSLTGASLIKQLQSGERDLERVWLQVEDSLNTKYEHLSFLIFCLGIF